MEVKELTSIGVIGETFSLVTHEPVSTAWVHKFKGNSNSGQLALQGARAPTDPGQAKLLVALQDPVAYACKLLLANGTIMYFLGQVMSYQTNVGSVNQITAFDTNLEISGKIITV